MSSLLGRAGARLAVPVTAAALCLTLAAPALADWEEPVATASPVNQSSARNATESDLATVGGVPYVAWNEDTTEGAAGSSSTIRVARLSADGTAWEKVANAGTHPISRLSSTSSDNPSIAEVDGRPWVAWEEGITATNSEIRVARLDSAGTAWVRTPDSLRPVNHLRTDPGGRASYPTIVGDGGTRPYVSFFEADPGTGSLFFEGSEPAKIWVMRLSADGTTWEEVGGGHVNPLAGFDAAFPRMTLVDGVPWLTYFQVELVGGNPTVGIRVSRLGDGGTWEQVGDPVLSGGPGTVENPDIAAVAGRPFVAAPTTLSDPSPRVRVFALDGAGTGWTDLGAASPSDKSAGDVSLADIGGQPWVSWHQQGGASDVGVAALREGAWEPIATPYRHGTAGGQIQQGPELADVNGFPWFSFTEGDGQSPGGPGVEPCCAQVRVARLEPEFSSPASQPTDDSATLLASMTGYGLPFPVGFQYGPDGTFSAVSDVAASTGSLFFRIVHGLTPSTIYGYRPVALAGTPLPEVTGASSYFVTDPAEEADPLVMAIVRAPDRVRRGQEVRLGFITTEAGQAVLRVRRDGELVGTVSASVEAGLRTIRWRASVPPGRYRLVLRLVSDSGQRAMDAVPLGVAPAR